MHHTFPISRRWFPAAVLLTGIALTLLAAYYAARTIQLRAHAQFERSALTGLASIRARFDVYATLLHGTAGFIAIENEITHDRFRRYVERLHVSQNYPGVQGIGFAPRVPAPEKQRLAASMSEQGEQHFHIWPESDRPDFYPIVYVEPEVPPNLARVGFDMFSEPLRREAMERARDTGEIAASGNVSLREENQTLEHGGFLIFCPVYQGDTIPQTVEDRRARLRGFTFGVFRSRDLFQSLFGDRALGIEIEIFDSRKTDESNLLFRSGKLTPSSLPFRQNFEETFPLDVSGRTWTAHFFAKPEPEGNWVAPLLLFSGALLSLAMFYLTRAEGRALRAAQQAAEQLQHSELALRESEDRLRKYATELEHRVAERTANLAQTVQSLEGVLYHVAHDLRAPLRGMASFTSILLEEYGPRLDERGRDYAERISHAAHRMDRLVQDLLAYGRLTHTAVPLSNVSLEAEVKELVHRFSEEIEARGATVEVSSPLPPMKANAAVLDQVLSNLLSNGLKFVRTDIQPRLRIHAEETTFRMENPVPKSDPALDTSLFRRSGKFVRLWVEDNGIGIPPEYHERIFRMFERLHGVGEYPGTGIGLAIVRKGVERMGGRVGLESKVGVGSRFWIELPAAE